MNERASLGIGLCVVAVLATICATRFEMAADIRHFLPEGNDVRLARVSRLLADSDQARTLVLSIEGEDRDHSMHLALQLEEQLRGDPEVESVIGGLDDARAAALESTLFPRRHALVDLPETPPAEIAESVATQLLLPQDAAARRRLLADPLAAWPAFLSELRAGEGRGLTLESGRFFSRDGDQAILLVRTTHSPFEFDHSEPLLRRIAESGVPVERAGAHMFAVEAESSIRASVHRIAAFSALGVVLLFLGAFRSPRSLLLVFLPAGIGVLAGLATVLLVSGRIHGLTLAFGASLVGVCVDYPVHLLGHQRLAGGTPREALRAVAPGLALGAATTVAGFAGLMATDFPGIREIALFAGAGVLAALGATLGLVPALAASRAPAPSTALAHRLDVVRARLMHRPTAAALVGTALVLALVGLPRIAWEDSVSALSATDPALEAEEARVRARVSQWDGGRLVVLFGDDLPSALDAAEPVHAALRAAVDAGSITAWHGPARVLPGPATQHRRVQDVADRAPSVLDALEARGLRRAPFAAFAAPPEPLDRAALAAAGLDALVQPFVVDLPEGVALLHFVAGVTDAPDVPEPAVYFDQGRFLDGIYGAYRQRTTRLLALGLCVVFAVLLLRYRRLVPALVAFLPAVLAAGATLGLLALLGVRPNLLHLAACLLVLSIGVDYGVFLVEQRDHPAGLRAALPSVAVAACTTALSFGTLAISPEPSLRAIGSVSGIGVFLALVLAPACLTLCRPFTSGLETDG